MTKNFMFCCFGKLFTFSVAMVKSVAMLEHAVDEKPSCYNALLLWYSLHIPCCYGNIVIKSYVALIKCLCSVAMVKC